jgi:hypothetical protein
MTRTLSTAIASLLLFAISRPATAIIYTFRDGTTTPVIGGTYAGTDDLMIRPDAPNENNGVRPRLEVNTPGGAERRSLLRFDVTSLAGQPGVAESITLRLFVSGVFATGSNDGGNIDIFRIANANAGWIEGTGNLSAALAGEPSWNNRVHPSTPWAGTAGLHTAGTDYFSTLLATFPWLFTSPPASGSSMDFVFNDVSFFSDWIAGLNPGLLIAARLNDDDMEMHSAEATALLRPMLIVDFQPVPEPSSLALLGLGTLGLVIRNRRRRAAK